MALNVGYMAGSVIQTQWQPPTEAEDEQRLEVTYRVSEHWGRWQRSGSVNLQSAAAGNVLGINSGAPRQWDLTISDDEFTALDQAIARLPYRLRAIMFVEFAESGSQPSKWRRVGLKRLPYRTRLEAAIWAIITTVPELVDKWRRKMLRLAHK